MKNNKKKWKGLFNYIFPIPPSNKFVIEWDEGSNTFFWIRKHSFGNIKREGYKTWFGVKLSAWFNYLTV